MRLPLAELHTLRLLPLEFRPLRLHNLRRRLSRRHHDRVARKRVPAALVPALVHDSESRSGPQTLLNPHPLVPPNQAASLRLRLSDPSLPDQLPYLSNALYPPIYPMTLYTISQNRSATRSLETEDHDLDGHPHQLVSSIKRTKPQIRRHPLLRIDNLERGQGRRALKVRARGQGRVRGEQWITS